MSRDTSTLDTGEYRFLRTKYDEYYVLRGHGGQRVVTEALHDKGSLRGNGRQKVLKGLR